MLASFGSRLATAVVQPTLQAVVAGVIGGVITGGALIAAGVVPPPAQPTTALLSCPGSGAVVANVPAGQSLLAVARSKDGAWLEIYIGQPGIDGAWAPAAAVQLQGTTEGLPVADCAAPTSVEPTPQPLPSPAPTAEPSVPGTIVPDVESPSPAVSLGPGITASPSPKPTKSPKPTPPPVITPPPTIPPTPVPTPTPTPTPPPDLTPPSITGVSITGAYTSGDGNYYFYPPAATGCPYHSATISASVTDTGGSGLSGFTVTLHWKDPFGNQYNQQMAFNLGSHLYNKTISAVNGWPESAYVEYWITASDNAGNQAATTHPPDGTHWLFTGQCLL